MAAGRKNSYASVFFALAPKIELPTRTIVLPISICARKEKKKEKQVRKPFLTTCATRHSSYRLDKVVRHAHRHLHLFGVLFEGAANVRVALHQLDKVRIGAGRVVVAKATDRHHAVTVQVGTLLRHEAVQVHGLRWIGAVLFCGGVKAVYF